MLFILLLPVPVWAGWGDILEIFSGKETPGESVTGLTNSEIVDGLKAALDKGISNAIENLGKTDGYYGNPQVRIPMPDSLQAVAEGLRTLGQEQMADDFELTMNRAAEQAVPEATNIFVDTLKSMSITEAKEILQGPDDAATEYFRGKSGQRIVDQFLPVVADATDRVGVTSRYKGLIDELGPLAKWIDIDAVDLDRYITNKAVDGLFLKIAEEEKRIRENPAARTTDILKKVFSE